MFMKINLRYLEGK